MQFQLLYHTPALFYDDYHRFHLLLIDLDLWLLFVLIFGDNVHWQDKQKKFALASVNFFLFILPKNIMLNKCRSHYGAKFE